MSSWKRNVLTDEVYSARAWDTGVACWTRGCRSVLVSLCNRRRNGYVREGRREGSEIGGSRICSPWGTTNLFEAPVTAADNDARRRSCVGGRSKGEREWYEWPMISNKMIVLSHSFYFYGSL